MESIGERITKARRYLGMNQKELCEKAEINEATLSRYENGLREPKAATLSKLAEILEVYYRHHRGKDQDLDDLW